MKIPGTRSFSRGRYAQYTEDHLHRLRLIQQLKEAFLPLHAIRTQLERLEPGGLAELAESAPSESAAEYIRRVTGQTPVVRESAPPPATAPPPSQPAPRLRAFSLGRRAQQVAEGEKWERIRLTEELELHARIPSSPETQKLIDRIRKEAIQHDIP